MAWASLRLSGPLWASLGLSGHLWASLGLSQRAPQPAKRTTGSPDTLLIFPGCSWLPPAYYWLSLAPLNSLCMFPPWSSCILPGHVGSYWLVPCHVMSCRFLCTGSWRVRVFCKLDAWSHTSCCKIHICWKYSRIRDDMRSWRVRVFCKLEKHMYKCMYVCMYVCMCVSGLCT